MDVHDRDYNYSCKSKHYSDNDATHISVAAISLNATGKCNIDLIDLSHLTGEGL